MIPKFAASEIYCPYRASPLQKGRLILYLLYLGRDHIKVVKIQPILDIDNFHF